MAKGNFFPNHKSRTNSKNVSFLRCAWLNQAAALQFSNFSWFSKLFPQRHYCFGKQTAALFFLLLFHRSSKQNCFFSRTFEDYQTCSWNPGFLSAGVARTTMMRRFAKARFTGRAVEKNMSRRTHFKGILEVLSVGTSHFTSSREWAHPAGLG